LRLWFRRIAILTLVGIAGLCAAVIGVGLRLSAPAHTAIGAPPADLNVEVVEFPSASGATIRGWFIAGQPGHGAVVLMHGVRGHVDAERYGLEAYHARVFGFLFERLRRQ
jgi:hypothetical protein